VLIAAASAQARRRLAVAGVTADRSPVVSVLVLPPLLLSVHALVHRLTRRRPEPATRPRAE
jgi:hypothetical protein